MRYKTFCRDINNKQRNFVATLHKQSNNYP